MISFSMKVLVLLISMYCLMAATAAAATVALQQQPQSLINYKQQLQHPIKQNGVHEYQQQQNQLGKQQYKRRLYNHKQQYLDVKPSQLEQYPDSRVGLGFHTDALNLGQSKYLVKNNQKEHLPHPKRKRRAQPSLIESIQNSSVSNSTLNLKDQVQYEKNGNSSLQATGEIIQKETPKAIEKELRTKVITTRLLKLTEKTLTPTTTSSINNSTDTSTSNPITEKTTIRSITTTTARSVDNIRASDKIHYLNSTSNTTPATTTTTTIRSTTTATPFPVTTTLATLTTISSNRSSSIKPKSTAPNSSTNSVGAHGTSPKKGDSKKEDSLTTSTTHLPLTTTRTTSTTTAREKTLEKSVDSKENSKEGSGDEENSSKETFKPQTTKHIENFASGKTTILATTTTTSATTTTPLAKTTIANSNNLNSTSKSNLNQDLAPPISGSPINITATGKTLYRYNISSTIPTITTPTNTRSSTTTNSIYLAKSTTIKSNPKPKILNEFSFKNPKEKENFFKTSSSAWEDFRNEHVLKPKTTSYFENFFGNSEIKQFYNPAMISYPNSYSRTSSFAIPTSATKSFKVLKDFGEVDDPSDLLELAKEGKEFLESRSRQTASDSFIETPLRYSSSDKQLDRQNNMDIVTIVENLPHFNMFNRKNIMPEYVKDSKYSNYFMPPFFGMEMPDEG